MESKNAERHVQERVFVVVNLIDCLLPEVQ
jgi:hypothetical protein